MKKKILVLMTTVALLLSGLAMFTAPAANAAKQECISKRANGYMADLKTGGGRLFKTQSVSVAISVSYRACYGGKYGEVVRPDGIAFNIFYPTKRCDQGNAGLGALRGVVMDRLYVWSYTGQNKTMGGLRVACRDGGKHSAYKSRTYKTRQSLTMRTSVAPARMRINLHTDMFNVPDGPEKSVLVTLTS